MIKRFICWLWGHVRHRDMEDLPMYFVHNDIAGWFYDVCPRCGTNL